MLYKGLFFGIRDDLDPRIQLAQHFSGAFRHAACHNDFGFRVLAKSLANGMSRRAICPIGHGAGIDDAKIGLFSDGCRPVAHLAKLVAIALGFVLIGSATKRCYFELFHDLHYTTRLQKIQEFAIQLNFMINKTEVGFVSIATSLFFILNATGLIPLFLGLLARFDQKRQLMIITRELVVALAVLLLFTFFGDWILQILGISRSIISVAGGVLLFLISLTMIFPKEEGPQKALAQEPMIIPLAIPIVSGPGAITAVMLYAHDTGKPFLVAGAAIAAWIPSLIILLLGSYIKQLLGEKGLLAVERLGGMLVGLIGTQMLTAGIFNLVKEFFHIG